MSTAIDEDVFTILTEDFDIPCDCQAPGCDKAARYTAVKKCCAHTLFFCAPCLDYVRDYIITGKGRCSRCKTPYPAPFKPLDFYTVQPL